MSIPKTITGDLPDEMLFATTTAATLIGNLNFRVAPSDPGCISVSVGTTNLTTTAANWALIADAVNELLEAGATWTEVTL